MRHFDELVGEEERKSINSLFPVIAMVKKRYKKKTKDRHWGWYGI